MKLLRFTEEELPRTATRKVKRSLVVNMMQEIEERTRSESDTGGPEQLTGDAAWLTEIVASVSSRALDEVSLNTRLADLGFDSLMFVELAQAIENAGGTLTAPDRLNEVQDVRELLACRQQRALAHFAQRAPANRSREGR